MVDMNEKSLQDWYVIISAVVLAYTVPEILKKTYALEVYSELAIVVVALLLSLYVYYGWLHNYPPKSFNSYISFAFLPTYFLFSAIGTIKFPQTLSYIDGIFLIIVSINCQTTLSEYDYNPAKDKYFISLVAGRNILFNAGIVRLVSLGFNYYFHGMNHYILTVLTLPFMMNIVNTFRIMKYSKSSDEEFYISKYSMFWFITLIREIAIMWIVGKKSSDYSLKNQEELRRIPINEISDKKIKEFNRKLQPFEFNIRNYRIWIKETYEIIDIKAKKVRQIWDSKYIIDYVGYKQEYSRILSRGIRFRKW